MLEMYLKSQHYLGLSHTVAVQITTTLNCLTSSVAEHKLHPGNITNWPYTVTLAVEGLIYLAWFFGDNSLSLSTMNIKPFNYKMGINYELHWKLSLTSLDCNSCSFSSVASTRARNQVLSEPSFSCFRTTWPLIKQVSSLCAVIERANQAGCWD
jgi:hypothetical protein